MGQSSKKGVPFEAQVTGLRAEETTPPIRSVFRSLLVHQITPYLLLVIGLGITVLVTIGAWKQSYAKDEEKFLGRTMEIQNRLAQEFDRYSRVLHGARALWTIHPHVNRDEWRLYVEKLELPAAFPDLKALGFIERVPSTNLTEFLESVRKDWASLGDGLDFHVHPDSNKQERFIVRFVEPLSVNRSAIGYDIGTESKRRAAAEAARDRGEPLVTRKITLVQATNAPGVLVLLPVYAQGIQATNLTLRRASIRGWVYAAFVVQELVSRVCPAGREDLDIEVYDSDFVSPADLLFSSRILGVPGVRETSASFEQIVAFHNLNGIWTLRIRAGPAFASKPWLSAPGYVDAAALGLCISFLVFGIVKTLVGTGQRAQRLANEMTAKLRLQNHAMACARNGIFILDATREDCPIIYANPAFERMTCYSVKGTLGKDTVNLLRGQVNRGANSGAVDSRLAGPEGLSVVREYHRYGAPVWVDFRLVPVTDERGCKTHFLGIVEDVTERKRAEKELAIAEQRYHELVDNLNVGVYRNTPGATGKFLEVNPAVVAMFEANSREELMNYSVSDLYVDPAKRLELSERLLLEGAVKDAAIELHTLKGRRFWAAITATMRKDADRGVFFDGIIVDITERKQAEAVLRQAYDELARSQQTLKDTLSQLQASHEELQRTQLQLIQAAKMESIGTLAAGVAHEVKNPLQTILIGLDYLGHTRPKPSEDFAMAIGDMKDAVWRANNIIKELLQLSADTAFELAVGDLNAVVNRSLWLMNSELIATRTRVVCRLEPGLPPVRMDVRKMEQVLLNLLINAVQAMAQQGTLFVSTQSGWVADQLKLNGNIASHFGPAERLVVAVIRDTGPGIAPEHLSRIFDPFFTTKPVGKGTGLGLSIVKKIIDLHEGALEVRNAAEGGVLVTLALRAWESSSAQETNQGRLAPFDYPAGDPEKAGP